MTLTQSPSDRPAGAGTVPVIVGAGLAGLVTALRMAPNPVVVLASQPLGLGAASGWAQGGVAAALGPDDSPDLHAADTLAAGVGLCEPEVVARITAAAPEAIDYLRALGARFDRTADGDYRLGLEGAHSRNRIVHAAGDATGAEILRAVVEAVRRTASITVLEGALARRVLIENGCVTGLLVELAGRPVQITTECVVLATGGSGQLWQHTTNPRGSRGQGLALAARAGAELRDLEMVQFHPTALDVGLDPMPLVSEAVRGAGAVLVDAAGGPLTDNPLAARDVVARAVWGELSRGGRVFLDARTALGPRFAEAFPTVTRACLAAGIDPATDVIPVRPAAHYQCGGVTVDLRGRTTVPGLWAVGEVASTGLHGANRLASNSLLEAVVCGGWVADDVASTLPGETGSLPLDARSMLHELPSGAGRPWQAHVPGTAEPEARHSEVRAVMSRAVGILRDGPELQEAEDALLDARRTDGDDGDDLALVALLVTHCARLRRESRGGHARTDHPQLDDRAAHTTVTFADACNGWDGALTRVGEPVATPRDGWDGALTRVRGAQRRVSAPPLASHFAHSGEPR